MLITVRELEAQPVEFDEVFQPEAIDFGPDYRQKQALTAAGRAELIREHRGSKQIVEDIRLVGRLSAEIEMLCARCLEPVFRSVNRDFDLLYRPLGVDRRAHDHLTAQSLSECPNCHERKLPHRACPKCGHYKDREVFEVEEAG